MKKDEESVLKLPEIRASTITNFDVQYSKTYWRIILEEAINIDELLLTH